MSHTTTSNAGLAAMQTWPRVASTLPRGWATSSTASTTNPTSKCGPHGSKGPLTLPSTLTRFRNGEHDMAILLFKSSEFRIRIHLNTGLWLGSVFRSHSTREKDSVVVCCCKLNNTRDCDEHLFGQVSTHTGRYQLPIFRCSNVHPWRYARP